MKRILLSLFFSFSIFSAQSAFAYTSIGVWFDGPNGSSFLTESDACNAWAAYYNATYGTERNIYSVDTHFVDPDVFYQSLCNINKDGNFYIQQKLDWQLNGGLDGTSALRFLTPSDALHFEDLPYWKYGTITGENPKSVCDQKIDELNAGTTYVYTYSHMEMDHSMGQSFSPSDFRCIAKKQKIQKNAEYPLFPVGFYQVALAKPTGATQGKSGNITVTCATTDVCTSITGSGGDSSSGDSSGGDSSGSSGSGLSSSDSDALKRTADATEASRESLDSMDSQLSLISTQIGNQMILADNYYNKSADSLTAINDVLERVKTDSGKMSLDLVSMLENLKQYDSNNTGNNQKIIDALDALKLSEIDNTKEVTDSNNDISNSVTTLALANSTGFSNLKEALDSLSDLTVTSDNADVVSGINNLRSDFNSNQSALFTALNTISSNGISNKDEIVSAIKGMNLSVSVDAGDGVSFSYDDSALIAAIKSNKYDDSELLNKLETIAKSICNDSNADNCKSNHELNGEFVENVFSQLSEKGDEVLVDAQSAFDEQIQKVLDEKKLSEEDISWFMQKYKEIFPTSSQCSPLTFGTGLFKITISCAFSETWKNLFGFFIYMWTLETLLFGVTDGIRPNGTSKFQNNSR